MADIEKMDLESKDLIDDRLEKLQDLLPEAFSESGIDFDKLRLLLGDEVDEGSERYAFTWPGKTDAIRQSQTVSTATLRPCPEKSRSRDGKDGSFDSDNIYIEGDNLEVLKLLQRGYHGKVKMIYIDPPYNTGHDFVYHDSFGNTIENYKEQAGLAGQSNAETSGRYHSDWCSMMYPRLKLARELLSDDGVIFISISNVELSRLITMCSDIYGESNFIDLFIWEKTQHFGRQKLNSYSNADYIVCFAKKLVDKGVKELLVEKVKNELQDAPLYNASNNLNTLLFPAGTVKFNMPDGIYNETSSEEYTLLDSVKIIDSRNENEFRLRFRSRWSNETVQRELDKGTTFWVKTDKFAIRAIYGTGKTANESPRQIIFTNTSNPKATFNRFGDRIDTSENASKEVQNLIGNAFSYPKPVSLIKYLISLLWTDGDFDDNPLVMDFFSGSGTTAQAVMDINLYATNGNARFTLVQLPEKAAEDRRTLCDIGEERIRRAGDKIKSDLDESNRQLMLGEEPKQLPDIGFRVFTLDDSGIEKPQPGKLMHEVVKPNRTELDIVFEMMLKWGLELTLPVEKSDAADYPVWSVACDELVCCMSPGLTIEALEAIADMEPKRVLILDSILNDTLKLNAVQIFKHASERIGTDIELRTV
ncbi:Adenine specific DNA methylase Mod [Mobiluncus mulieris]|uniref:site-specific DNA-methyltransferase n=1 Tax=Mobiluncus mulieris TaxID=2052 RepID=UPI00019F95D7|nr:site-specific DNA-methyltransferase [Mobiluncus mulieris]EEJ54565.1 DNA (cytosine-5-)-methyltransferase [Mobiluncus mulieris ATCC 35243]SPX76447.1 Adenine specific DNA methylase Mod [Mobiluncus mulieris]